MIIGDGTIASAIIDREDLVFFASGVSNSQEKKESEYQREADLLMKQDMSRHIVYFSTLSVFFTESRYTRHKLSMEELVKRHFKHYTIMRLGNSSWAGNEIHLVNFLKKKIKNKESFEIRDVYRYILLKEEFQHWLRLIPEFNCEMNVTGIRMKVADIVNNIRKGLI